jgi:hypothetical protein
MTDPFNVWTADVFHEAIELAVADALECDLVSTDVSVEQMRKYAMLAWLGMNPAAGNA